MSSAPVRGIVPHRHRRHHHHHHHHEKQQRRHHSQHNEDRADDQSYVHESVQNTLNDFDDSKKDELEGKRPKVNPIFLWAAQREQRIVEVRCEDYDKRNRIKLTKTAYGWRSIPRTALTAYSAAESAKEDKVAQHEVLSSTSKVEEKENSSKKLIEIKQVGVDELDDTRVEEVNQLNEANETQEERERHKHKRKKHSDLPKNKKRKSDSEVEENSGEVLITTNWKMKKRNKLDKCKKRKKICIEDVLNKDDVNNSSEIEVKEDSKKESENIDNVEKSEELSNLITTEQSAVITTNETVDSTEDEHKKCNDLEKLQKNRHLQPRVVLEPLHLSQLPTRVHRRLVNRTELENNAEQNEGSNIDEIVEGNMENNSHGDNGSRIDPENEETIVDKEDLQDILNMLDANHFPANANETSSSLIENKNIANNCSVSLSAIIPNSNQKDDNKTSIPSKECAKTDSGLTVRDKRNKFGKRNNIKQRVGSKSLDETIERLEKSINNQKKVGSMQPALSHSDSELNKQKTNKADLKSNNKSSNCQNEAVSDDLSNSSEQDHQKNMQESSKILQTLRNTPGLSVSLAANGKKCDPILPDISHLPKMPGLRLIAEYRTSPDSQSEVAERTEHCSPSTSVVKPKPLHQQRLETASPFTKNRVQSPESTVHFPKNEGYSLEPATLEESRNPNYQMRFNSYCNNEPQYSYPVRCVSYNNYFYNERPEFAAESAKLQSLKNSLREVTKHSEAQAKLLGVPQKYPEINNINKFIEDFRYRVSDDPSVTVFPRGSSSAYLERLLPSPPCSVSCSEDAQNHPTYKNTLTLSNNVDSRNQEKREKVSDLNTPSDSESGASPNHFEERFSEESPHNDAAVLGQIPPKILEEHTLKYLASRNDGRPMSSIDIHSPYVSPDYIFPKRPLSAEWTVHEQRTQAHTVENFPNNMPFGSPHEVSEITEPLPAEDMDMGPPSLLDPATQLRELLKTSRHLIPDPLLVPRSYLPALATAPYTEIPKLITTKPDLRLPEALSRPDLLSDPDLLVISLSHLQHVLDNGESVFNELIQPNQGTPNPLSQSEIIESAHVERSGQQQEQLQRRKKQQQQQQQQQQKQQQQIRLSCKPIGKLMPAPIDLSSHQRIQSAPPLLRVRSGLLKQEPEVSSTAYTPEESQLWHPLFGSMRQRQEKLRQQQQHREVADFYREQTEQYQRHYHAHMQQQYYHAQLQQLYHQQVYQQRLQQQQQLQQQQHQQQEQQQQQPQPSTSWHTATLAS